MPYIVNAVYSVITLYMLLILLRWLGPWIHIDLDSPRLRWATRLTDPLLDKIRTIPAFKSTAVFDYSPIVAMLALWLIRDLTVSILLVRQT